ncbi:putative nuclease HARBI1 isoform X2 [Tanacetum coccineum]
MKTSAINRAFLGKAPEVPFVANDVTYKHGEIIFTGRDIIHEWDVLMTSFRAASLGSNDVKRIRYKQAHEATRKDVERAFDVLKKKWAIVRTLAWSRSLKRITHLMYSQRKKKGNLSRLLSGGTTS